jgi:hypothetical protein
MATKKKLKIVVKKPVTKKKVITVRAKKVAKPVLKKRTQVVKPLNKKLAAKKAVRPAAKKMAAKVMAKSAIKRSSAVGAGSPLPISIPPMAPRPAAKPLVRPKTKVKVKPQPTYTPLTSEERRILRTAPPQFTYMKAPAVEHEFQVGDTVEVFCDHEKSGDRVRGWVKGIVVQVDNKLVAVQFRSNVFLTDGWMVPDRILWYPLTSDQIREIGAGKRAGSKEILEY